MSHIFIAHVEEDADIALGIALGLEEAGYRTWTYELDSIIGTSYIVRTGEAVAQSDAVVVIISPDSLSSIQVTKEVVRAHESGRHFLPILRGISHIEFQQRQPEWREAIGSATSITLPKQGVSALVPLVSEGVKALGIRPAAKPDTDRIARLRSTLESPPPAPAATPKAPEYAARTTEKTGQPFYKKPLFLALASIIVIAAVVAGIILSRGGQGTDTSGTPTTAISGNMSSVNPTTSTMTPTASQLPGGTSTPLSGSTSTIAPDTSTVQPGPTLTTSTGTLDGGQGSPLTTATSTFNSAGQLTSGGSTQGTLKTGETHWYYMNLEAGDAIYAVLSEGANSTSFYPLLELLGPEGKVIASDYSSVTTAIDKAITTTGKYTFRVRDNNNTGGNYVLSFMQLSQSVNPLASGVSLQGRLEVPGDVNWYTFDANSGDAIYAVLSESDGSTSFYPLLELLGPEGSVIASDYSSVTTAIDKAITTTGKYTFRVRDNSNIGGNYVLSFMQLSQSVNPLASGVSLQGQLKVPGDVNWYTFEAESGDAVYAVLSEGTDSTNFYPLLELLGPGGSVIASDYSSVTTAVDKAITTTGKYTFRVRDNSNIGGNYVLSFMQLSKSVNPLTSGVSIQGKLKVPGDVNWYTFEAGVGDVVNIVLSEGENSSSFYPLLELLGPEGKVIASDYSSVTVSIDIAISTAGKYTVRIRDNSNTGGNYVLSFNLMDNS